MRHAFLSFFSLAVHLSLLTRPVAAQPNQTLAQVSPTGLPAAGAERGVPDPSNCTGRWPNSRPPDYIQGDIPEITTSKGGPGGRALTSFAAHYKISPEDSIKHLRQSATARLRFVPFLMHESYQLVKTDANLASMNDDDRCFVTNFANYASINLYREARTNYIQLCNYLLTNCPISNKLTLEGVASSEPLDFIPPADSARRIRPFLRTLSDPFLTKDQLTVLVETLYADARSAESLTRDDLDVMTSNLSTLRSSPAAPDQPTPGAAPLGSIANPGNETSPAIIAGIVVGAIVGAVAASVAAVRIMEWLREKRSIETQKVIRDKAAADLRDQAEKGSSPSEVPPNTTNNSSPTNPPDSNVTPACERNITVNVPRDTPACLPKIDDSEVTTESLDADEALSNGMINSIGSDSPAAEAVTAEINAAVAVGEGAGVAAVIEAGIEAAGAVAATVISTPAVVVGAVAGLGYLIYHFYEKTVSSRDLERSGDEGLPTGIDLVQLLHNAANTPVSFVANRNGELYEALHKDTVTRMLFKLLVLDVAARTDTPKPLVLRPLPGNTPLYTKSLLVHLFDGLPEGTTGQGAFQFTYLINGFRVPFKNNPGGFTTPAAPYEFNGTLPRTHGNRFVPPNRPASDNNIMISQENKGPDFFAVDPWYNGTDMLLSLTSAANGRIGAALYMFNRERTALRRSWKSISLASSTEEGVNTPDPSVTSTSATIAIMVADVDGKPGTDIVQISRDANLNFISEGYVNVYSPAVVTGRLKDGRANGCDVNQHRCTGYLLSSSSRIPLLSQDGPRPDGTITVPAFIFNGAPPYAIATDMDADGIAEILLLKQGTISAESKVLSLAAIVLKRTTGRNFALAGVIQSPLVAGLDAGTKYVISIDPLKDGHNIVVISTEAPGVDRLSLQYFSLDKIQGFKLTRITPKVLTLPGGSTSGTTSLPFGRGAGLFNSIWFSFPKNGDTFLTNMPPGLTWIDPNNSYLARLYIENTESLPNKFQIQFITFSKSSTGELIIDRNFQQPLQGLCPLDCNTMKVTDLSAINITTETNRWGGLQLLDLNSVLLPQPVPEPQCNQVCTWYWRSISGNAKEYIGSGYFRSPDATPFRNPGLHYMGSLRMRVVMTDEFNLPPLAQ